MSRAEWGPDGRNLATGTRFDRAGYTIDGRHRSGKDSRGRSCRQHANTERAARLRERARLEEQRTAAEKTARVEINKQLRAEILHTRKAA